MQLDRRLLIMVVAAGAVGAAAACGRNTQSTVTLGAAGPFSQEYGKANKRGIQLALDEINSSPAWANGKRLQVNFVDDSGTGERATSVAQAFVDDPHVVAVIGHVTSGAMVSAARVYDKHLAAVATTATSPALTGISPWAFRVIPSDSANGRTIAQYMNKLGRKRAAVLYENNAYGRGLADSFRRSFSGVVVSTDPIDEGSTESFEPFISFYKREKPDVVFVAGTDVSGLAFLKEARRQRLAADLVGGDGWQTVASNPEAEDIYVGSPFTAVNVRPEVQRFVDAYRRKFNSIPDGNAALAYDATKLLAQAIEKVGPDRQKIRDYIANLDDGDAYHGVTGNIRFGRDGDPVGKGIIMTRVHLGLLMAEP